VTVAFMLQAAAISLGNHATELGIGTLVALAGWQLKVTITLRDDARTLKQWAFGAEGGNGANGQLKDHELRIHDLEGPHTHRRKSDP
jgi:hypothetical protein